MSPQVDPGELVLESLYEALKGELTAVHQYLLHANLCQNWGFMRLAELNRKEYSEELQHSEALIERILFLNGAPSMTDLFPIASSNNVKDQFESDLAMEKDAVERLNTAIKRSVEAGDHVSRQLFDRILVDEAHHIDYLEEQLNIIEQVGLGAYLTQQIRA